MVFKATILLFTGRVKPFFQLLPFIDGNSFYPSAYPRYLVITLERITECRSATGIDFQLFCFALASFSNPTPLCFPYTSASKKLRSWNIFKQRFIKSPRNHGEFHLRIGFCNNSKNRNGHRYITNAESRITSMWVGCCMDSKLNREVLFFCLLTQD